jgi:hypothetical protein
MSATGTDRVLASAIATHADWKNELVHAIVCGSAPHSPAEAARAERCDLGQWLASIDLATDPDGGTIETLRNLHDRFHLSAAKVLELALANQGMQAEDLLLGDFTTAQDRMVRVLLDLKHRT